MGKLKRDALRAKLKNALVAADAEDYLLSLWAIGRLQAGDANVASQVIGHFPQEAIGSKMGDRNHVHEWEIETLANECIMAPRRGHPYVTPARRLLTERYPAMVHTVNLLRELENEEYGCSNYDVLKEIYRIALRQFEWQRGWFNKANFYRAAFLYSKGELERRLINTVGLATDDILYVAFGLFVFFSNFHTLSQSDKWEHLNIETWKRDKLLARFSNPIEKQIDLAKEVRKRWTLTAYRPSVFRTFPISSRRADSSLHICPLPELILHRATQGLFYDVVDGSGPIRSAMGKSFERYIAALLGTGPIESFETEFQYRIKKEKWDSPDFLLNEREKTFCIVECKAHRLSFPARFGDNPESERGYDELSHGIFQIWRFRSHCRRGLIERTFADDAVGLIVTLDSWLSGGHRITEHVLRMANLKADNCPGILPEDRIPIGFAEVADLEMVLWNASSASLKSALVAAAGEKRGWLFSSVHEPPVDERSPFPFDDELASLLPWWGQLEERRRP
jgi:hypothetical protein